MANFKEKLKNYLISYPLRKFVSWIKIEVQEHLSRDNKKLKHLKPDQISQIQAFASPYYTTSCAFHDFYTQHTGRFFVEYIPDDIYFSKIDTFFNDWNKAFKLDDKCYYDRLLSKTVLKLPETICYCINGFWLDSKYRCLSREDVLGLIIKNERAFLKKSVSSSGGRGVRYFDINDYTDMESRKRFLDKIIDELGENIIVQVPIEQSDKLSILNPSSVNTLRILSLIRPDGRIKICSSIVRMGRNSMRIDNASSGGITCGINPDGSLKTIAFSPKGEKFTKHPDTGVKFDTITIPDYSTILDIVRKTHPQFPNFRLVSWDIAIDKNDEPLLVELNLCCGELDFHQLNNGPVFGEDTKEILQEVFGNNR